MEIRQLEYFVAVADMGGFTRAAQVCHVVQTTVSHAIAALERELGVELFVREGRSVRLTPEGRVLLSDARTVVERVRRAERDLRRRQSSQRDALLLGYYGAGLGDDFPETIRRFRAQTGLDVVLRGADSDAARDDLAAEVRLGAIDAFLIAHAPIAEYDRWARQIVVAYNRVFLACAPDDELADERSSLPRGGLGPVAASICLFRASRTDEYVAAMRAWLAEDFGVDSTLISWNDSMEDVRLLVRCGQCRTLSFRNADAPSFEEGGLVYRRIDELEYLPVTLVCRRDDDAGASGDSCPPEFASPAERFAEVARAVSSERGIDVIRVEDGATVSGS
ncbi:MAG: LysR family transcriptional regulator [Coriobacteriia bacterium]|nr:LysR family transcriptional regulator [Coriobacteriia bacterium]MBS5477163.1 LysR family transcriptional regulator [Coriobacteriia bacterium]